MLGILVDIESETDCKHFGMVPVLRNYLSFTIIQTFENVVDSVEKLFPTPSLYLFQRLILGDFKYPFLRDCCSLELLTCILFSNINIQSFLSPVLGECEQTPSLSFNRLLAFTLSGPSASC